MAMVMLMVALGISGWIYIQLAGYTFRGASCCAVQGAGQNETRQVCIALDVAIAVASDGMRQQGAGLRSPWKSGHRRLGLKDLGIIRRGLSGRRCD